MDHSYFFFKSVFEWRKWRIQVQQSEQLVCLVRRLTQIHGVVLWFVCGRTLQTSTLALKNAFFFIVKRCKPLEILVI